MDHPYRGFLHRLEHPARYLGAEHGVIRKPWDGVRARFCMAFPDTYELGMSHLGLKVLYETLGREPDLSCERCFAPWADLEAELRERGLPLLSLESARPLADFHVVGFSLQYELTFTTVLCMLELGGIPLRAAARAQGDPLVVGGGPVASHPEPVAPFFDLFLLGDAERALPELLRAEADLRAAGVGRAERVARLGALPEIYAPAVATVSLDQATGRLVVGEQGQAQATRRIEWDLSGLVDTGGGPVPSIEAVFDRAAIEVARGCNQGCRFCQAGFLYRPLRERPLDAVLAALTKRAAQGGYDEVSLTALSTADYSALGPLLRGAAASLAPIDVSMSVSSLRAIGLDGALLDDLRTGRAGSLTFAPEAGSQRMRDRINKRISEEGLLDTARRVAARGWSHLKLYFMIGLPGEEDEDVYAILDLAERVRRAAREGAPRREPRVTMAVNNFVPKPHTPMQWCRMEDAARLAGRQSLLRSHPLARRLGLRLHHIDMSLLEGRLARGDRSLAEVIEGAYRDGARFDGWEDHFDARRWERAFGAASQDPARWLEALPRGARLPWDHLDIGVEPGFLEREAVKMEAGRPGPACGVPPSRRVGSGDAVTLAPASDVVEAISLVPRSDVGEAISLVPRTDVGEAISLAPASDTGDAATLVPESAVAPATPVEEEPSGDPALHVACLRCGLPCLEAPPLRAIDGLPSGDLAPALAPPGPEPAPAAAQAGPEGVRLRLLYEKKGPAAFLSHLDLVRQLPRVLRRAGLKPVYTRGFNPRPKLQFTPPLPVGAEAEADACEVWIALAPEERPEPFEVLARLEASTLPGLRFHGARWLASKEPELSRLCEGARYRFEPSLGPGRTAPDGAALQAAAAALLERPSFVVERKDKGGGKGKSGGKGKGGGKGRGGGKGKGGNRGKGSDRGKGDGGGDGGGDVATSGTSAGRSESTSAGRSESAGESAGASTSAGRSESTSAGRSESTSAGRSESAGASTSAGRSESAGASTSAGRSESAGAGRSESTSAGRSESAGAGRSESTSADRSESAGAGATVSRDLRASLDELDVTASPTGGLAICFRLSQRPEGTLRPRELLEALWGHADPEGRLVRLHHVHGRGAEPAAVLTLDALDALDA